MKESKTGLLLILSLLLLAVSVTLLWSWASRFYEFDKARQAVVQTKAADRTPVKTDSVRLAYETALQQLDRSIDSVWNSATSMKEDLAIRLASFYKLRAELTALFNKEQTGANIELARLKILELQEKLKTLRMTNDDIEAENRRLVALLNRSTEAGPSTGIVNIERNSKALPGERKPLVASELHLAAIASVGDNEQETSQATATSKFVGSLVIRNSNPADVPAELVIVLLQPDGSVLQKSTWESGSFETSAGRKIYSCKLLMDPSATETRLLNFTLNSGNTQKGRYTLQVYHNGVIIGRLVKPLS